MALQPKEQNDLMIIATTAMTLVQQCTNDDGLDDETMTTETQEETAPTPTVGETIATTEATIIAPPATPILSKKTRRGINLIPYNEKAFELKKDGTVCSEKNNARSAQSRAIKKLGDIIDDPLLSDEQKVVVLRVASTSKRLRHYFKSAGLIDVPEYDTLKYMVNQMKKLITKARETNHRFGCANEDKRGFIQSIVLVIVDDDDDDDDGVSTTTKPTKKARLELLGLPSTGYEHMREQYVKRKEIMEGKKRNDWSKPKTKHGFWLKVKPEVREKIDTWIRAHHHVIHSPITKDTVLVRDPADPTQRTPKSKICYNAR